MVMAIRPYGKLKARSNLTEVLTESKRKAQSLMLRAFLATGDQLVGIIVQFIAKWLGTADRCRRRILHPGHCSVQDPYLVNSCTPIHLTVLEPLISTGAALFWDRGPAETVSHLCARAFTPDLTETALWFVSAWGRRHIAICGVAVTPGVIELLERTVVKEDVDQALLGISGPADPEHRAVLELLVGCLDSRFFIKGRKVCGQPTPALTLLWPDQTVPNPRKGTLSHTT